MKKGLRKVGLDVRRVRAEPRRSVASEGEKTWLERVMAIDGMTSEHQVKALHRLARKTTSGCIVEVGSYRGRSTAALAYGSKRGAGVPVYAIDPHAEFKGLLGGTFGPKDRAAFFRSMLDTKAWEVVRLINLGTDVVGPGWKEPVAFLWIDGDHSYEAVARDFRAFEPHLTPDAIVAFDDSTSERSGATRFVGELEGEGWSLERRIGKVSVFRRA